MQHFERGTVPAGRGVQAPFQVSTRFGGAVGRAVRFLPTAVGPDEPPPIPGAQRRSVRTTYRREAGQLTRPAKVWWHRDLAPAHTSRAVRYWRNDETHTHIRTAPRRPPASRSGSRAGSTAGASWRRSPSWSSATARGLAQVVLPAGTPSCRRRRRRSTVVGTATANAQAPGGVEVTDATVTALSEPADTPAVELWRPTLDAGLPTLLDHAADHLAPPGPAGEVGARRRQPARLPRAPSTPRLHRGPLPQARRVRRPRAAPTSSRSTTSAGRRTSPRARSSTSSSWSGSSSASTRSGRCSAPSRTTPCGTSRSTSRSTSSSASSRTTAR